MKHLQLLTRDKQTLVKIKLTISEAVSSLLKYLKLTKSLVKTYWGTFEFASFFFSSAAKCRISFIIMSKWSDAHSALLLTTSYIILFNFVIISCCNNSSIEISREATMTLTILTVNALNLACPALKYSSSTDVNCNFFSIITKAAFRSRITDKSFRP